MDAGWLLHLRSTVTAATTPHECGCLQWLLTSSRCLPVTPKTSATAFRRHFASAAATVAAASSSFVTASLRQNGGGGGGTACCIGASSTVAAAPPAAVVDDDDDADGDGDADEVSHSNVERRLVSGERVLQISKADFTVSSVIDKIKRGKLDLRPSYQRDYVWDKKTASKLIESLLLNIPLPTMFFHEKSQGQLEVVDGKQRLTSIWCFMEEEIFPDGSDFALCGLDVLSQLNGKKYSDLEDSLQEIMRDFALNVHTISRNSDDEVVFEVFERLNMGSTQLNEQELRNCVFQGSYNELLDELVNHPHMLEAFRQDTPHKRMRDKEFVLRFFCLRHGGVDGFKLPVKTWLNEEMKRNQFVQASEIEDMTLDFYRCISLSVKVFEDRVFRIPRGLKYDVDLNACLWDTVMLGFLHYKDCSLVLSRKDEIRQALHKLLVEDGEFRGQLVSNPRALRFRTERWNGILTQILGPPS